MQSLARDERMTPPGRHRRACIPVLDVSHTKDQQTSVSVRPKPATGGSWGRRLKSLGDVANGEHVLGTETHQQLTFDRITPPELLGQLLAHVARSDPRRVRQHLRQVCTDRHRTAHDHERVRRSLVVNTHAGPTRARQRTARNPSRASVEHDLVAVEQWSAESRSVSPSARLFVNGSTTATRAVNDNMRESRCLIQ